VGNAVADDKHLVFASGSLQLINALVHALSPDADADASPPARVVAIDGPPNAQRIESI